MSGGEHHAADRHGLSVIEVLVALVIVSVGLLGMAGTSALSLRSATAASRELGALRRLEQRLASIASAGCGRASSGVEGGTGDAVRVSWTVHDEIRGVRLLEADARWHVNGAPRVLVLRSALLC